jgi:ribonuclease P protein component
MANEQFPSRCHVRRGSDFRRAYQRRTRVADGRMVIFGHPNGLPYPRLGISASRRLGGAVVRNRWKRLLREAFRVTRTRLPEGIDLIVIPRPEAEPSLAALRDALPRLAGWLAKKMVR